MNRIKNIWLFTALLLSSISAFCQNEQSVVTFPFDQIINSYPLINPANLDPVYGFDATIGYNDFNALSNDVYSMYGQLNYSTRTSDSLKTHRVSVTLLPEKEGVFISRSRAYLGYSYTFPLSRQLYLSGGVQVGMINYSIKPNAAVGGSSGSALDASVGMSVIGHNFTIGLSGNQLPQNSVELYFTPLTFSRFYTAVADKYFEFNPMWKLRTHVFTMLDTEYSNLTATALLYYSDQFSFGASLRKQYGLIPQLGFEDIRMRDLLFSFSTSYRMAVNRESVTNTNRVELTLGVKFVKE
ncbi:MAG: type IX secretion system membrane protein PorP/SprF [Cyclobacteriaceae bacterium]